MITHESFGDGHTLPAIIVVVEFESVDHQEIAWMTIVLFVLKLSVCKLDVVALVLERSKSTSNITSLFAVVVFVDAETIIAEELEFTSVRLVEPLFLSRGILPGLLLALFLWLARLLLIL